MEKQKNILMAALGILLLAIVIALVLFFKYNEKYQGERVREQQTQTTPAKEEILQALSAPAKNAPPVSEKEQQEILQGLSAPSKNSTPVSEKDKQDILNALSAPAK